MGQHPTALVQRDLNGLVLDLQLKGCRAAVDDHVSHALAQQARTEKLLELSVEGEHDDVLAPPPAPFQEDRFEVPPDVLGLDVHRVAQHLHQQGHCFHLFAGHLVLLQKCGQLTIRVQHERVLVGAKYITVEQCLQQCDRLLVMTGNAAVRADLERLGSDVAGLSIVDGSGLSYQNRVTPRALVSALRVARDSFGFGLEFVAALPIAAADGTLEKRPGGAADRVRAKTGLLTRITSLSGYAVSADGHPIG